MSSHDGSVLSLVVILQVCDVEAGVGGGQFPWKSGRVSEGMERGRKNEGLVSAACY